MLSAGPALGVVGVAVAVLVVLEAEPTGRLGPDRQGQQHNEKQPQQDPAHDPADGARFQFVPWIEGLSYFTSMIIV